MRHLPPGAVAIADAPPRRSSGRSGRAPCPLPQGRRLSPEQRAAIRADAGNRTLRALAAEFGVSHETIRTVLRERGAVSVR